MVERLMAAVRAVLGRERRHGNGAFTLGRRSTDPEARKYRVALARVQEQEHRLASYAHRFPR